MDQMIKTFEEKGLEVPDGLIQLIKKSPTCKAIFRTLWAATKFGAGLGASKGTYVFPAVVREAVRERFPDEQPALYDGQYEGRCDVYYVSIEDLCLLRYPSKKD